MKSVCDQFTCVTHAPPPRPAPRRDSPIPRQPNGPRNNCRFLLTDSRPLRMTEEIVKTAHVPVSFSFQYDPNGLSSDIYCDAPETPKNKPPAPNSICSNGQSLEDSWWLTLPPDNG